MNTCLFHVVIESLLLDDNDAVISTTNHPRMTLVALEEGESVAIRFAEWMNKERVVKDNSDEEDGLRTINQITYSNVIRD
jgi:hypothetical protein